LIELLERNAFESPPQPLNGLAVDERVDAGTGGTRARLRGLLECRWLRR
jgi:hypothetical protein